MDADRELWVACQAVVAEHNAGAGRDAPVYDARQRAFGDDMVYERKVYM